MVGDRPGIRRVQLLAVHRQQASCTSWDLSLSTCHQPPGSGFLFSSVLLVGNAFVVWRKCPCNILPQNKLPHGPMNRLAELAQGSDEFWGVVKFVWGWW